MKDQISRSSADVYEVLKQRIISLEYPPGYILNEVDIANEFSLSRTPVREAFQKLQNDRFLNIVPRIGAQVALIDFRMLKHAFEVKKELDGMCARLAAQRATHERINELERIITRLKDYDQDKDYLKIIEDDLNFHIVIWELSQNPVLIEILETLHTQAERLWNYTQQKVTNINGFIDTFELITQALKEGDKEKAEYYARAHVEAFVDQVKNELL
ncbi:MAG: GntR family transcriptional regulator [Firmicutes bacterium]|nr:GntR family transcriptional regulator [Bacillota bacterium]NSW92483.1 GntR family transcriptional regulator [Bacillota bacterium]